MATVAAGLAHADATRDPTGARLLAALQHIGRSEFEPAYELFVAIAGDSRDDVLADYCLVQAAVSHHRPDEATALVRRLHREQPELIFGVDLADAFRRDGRPAAAFETVIRDWVAAAPDNVVARVELARVAAEVGRGDDAVAHAREALLVNGERGDALPELFEAAIASEQYAVAQRVADRMLLGNALTRARGRYRTAMVAVFEGRFSAGYDSVRRAIDEHRAFGYQSELVQCLELARSLARLVGDIDAQRRFTADLAETFAIVVGDAATAAATRYELALLERRGAPSIDEHLAGLAEGPPRDVARRRMLRMAAIADCGSPHKAVAAGFSAWEENTASLLALGLCAMRLRELELAARSLERAMHQWSSLLGNQNCPYHAVLARFHLAGVVAELGDRPRARALLDSFVRSWGAADRPIPEVAQARQVRAHI
jgi:tetratricopeptide (TPR) repeat protein